MTEATFRQWRSDIIAELEAAEAALTAANEACAAAIAEVVPMRDNYRATSSAMNLQPRHERPAAALQRRVLNAADELRQAESRLTIAHNAVKNASTQIRDLKLALEQLDLVLPPAATAESAA